MNDYTIFAVAVVLIGLFSLIIPIAILTINRDRRRESLAKGARPRAAAGKQESGVQAQNSAEV